MSFFDQLKSKMGELRGSLETGLKKYKNKATLDAMMAGCAYVAAADGSIGPEEKQKMAGLVRNSSVTSVFDAGDAIKVFNSFAEKFEFDQGVGKSEALLAISKVRKDADLAKLIVRGCIIIGGADGHFDEVEKAAVRDICRELGLAPREFDL